LFSLGRLSMAFVAAPVQALARVCAPWGSHSATQVAAVTARAAAGQRTLFSYGISTTGGLERGVTWLLGHSSLLVAGAVACAARCAMVRRTRSLQPGRQLFVTVRAEGDDQSEVSQIDFRVGTVVSCEKHPDSDKLLVETIDLGEDEPRKICSGIANFYSPDQMTGKRVVVVSNLKARKIGGIPSNGMILCASKKDGPEAENYSALQVVDAPEGVEAGERIVIEVEGFSHGEVAAPNRVGKKKLFDKVAPHLCTNAEGTVCYKTSPFMTTAGPCTAVSVTEGTVS